MRSAIRAVCVASLLVGCGSSQLDADDANEPRHAIRIIATDPSGFDAGDAIAKELEARDDFEPKVLDVAATAKLLGEMGIKTSKAQLPANQKRLRGKSVDGWLDVKMEQHMASDDPSWIEVRLFSTHDPSRYLFVKWKNAWGGMKGSLADATMRKSLKTAAKEIAEELALQLNDRTKPKQ